MKFAPLLAVLVCLLALAPPALASHQTGNVYLRVTPTGTGTVTSGSSGISCPPDCDETYLLGQSCTFVGIGEGSHGADGRLECETVYPDVTLASSPGAGWQFSSWSGAGCSGTAGCNPDVTSDDAANPTTVSATFNDVTAPQVAINVPAASAKLRGLVNLDAQTSDNNAVQRVEFRVRGVLVGTDTTHPYGMSFNTASVPDGAATFTYTSFDPTGNSAAAERSATIDNTKPSVGAAGPDAQTFGPGTTQSWTLSATDATTGVAAVECRLTPAAFAPCSGGASAHSVSDLPEGTHTLEFRARDGAGNESDVVTRTVIIDATAPTTTITGGPADAATFESASVAYAFAASETATFACRVYPAGLTPPEFGSCSGTGEHAAAGFSPGTYAFEVRATDAVGNVGPAVKRTFTVAAPPTNGGTGSGTGAGSGGGTVAGSGTGTTTPTSGPGVTTGGTALVERIVSPIVNRWSALRGKTRVVRLRVDLVPVGAAVAVRCKGRGCPFKARSFVARNGVVDLKSTFKKRLAAKAVIEIRIMRPGAIGKVVRYTTRKKGIPTSKVLCLPVGASVPALSC